GLPQVVWSVDVLPPAVVGKRLDLDGPDLRQRGQSAGQGVVALGGAGPLAIEDLSGEQEGSAVDRGLVQPLVERDRVSPFHPYARSLSPALRLGSGFAEHGGRVSVHQT